MKRQIQITGLALSAIILSGCKVFSTSCEAPPEGEEVASIPTLRVPDGIPAPDTGNALRIPPLDTPEPLRVDGAPCLEEPPPYSAGWSPSETAAPAEPGAEPAPPPKKRRWWWPWG